MPQDINSMRAFRKLKVEHWNGGRAPAVADFTRLIHALPRSSVVSFSVQGSVNHGTAAFRMANNGENIRLLDAKWPSVLVNCVCMVDPSSRLVSVQKSLESLSNEVLVWTSLPTQSTEYTNHL